MLSFLTILSFWSLSPAAFQWVFIRDCILQIVYLFNSVSHLRNCYSYWKLETFWISVTACKYSCLLLRGHFGDIWALMNYWHTNKALATAKSGGSLLKTNIRSLWGERVRNGFNMSCIPVQLFISLIDWGWCKKQIGANKLLADLQNVESAVWYLLENISKRYTET